MGTVRSIVAGPTLSRTPDACSSARSRSKRVRHNAASRSWIARGGMGTWRQNFRIYVVLSHPNVGSVRCSPLRYWYVRFSMKQLDNPTGSHWVVIDPPDVAADRDFAYNMQTPLTWDLQ
jgi:hypothetical protein